jgi:hypothetical protein
LKADTEYDLKRKIVIFLCVFHALT